MKLYYRPAHAARRRTSCSTRSAQPRSPSASTCTRQATEDGRATSTSTRRVRFPRSSSQRRRARPKMRAILQYLGDRSSVGEVLHAARQFRALSRIWNWYQLHHHRDCTRASRPLFKAQTPVRRLKQFIRDASAKRLDLCRPRARRRAVSHGRRTDDPRSHLFVITGWAEKSWAASIAGPTSALSASGCCERPSVRNVLRFEGLLQEEPAG